MFWLPIASANKFGYKITGTFSLHNLTALTVLISEQIRNATCSVLALATVLGHRRFNSFFCIYLLLIQPSINNNNKPNIGRLSGRPNPLFYLKFVWPICCLILVISLSKLKLFFQKCFENCKTWSYLLGIDQIIKVSNIIINT